VNIADLFRYAAAYMESPEGRHAAGLPFEQPTKLELVINLKTAG
jgi:hypothetical protein